MFKRRALSISLPIQCRILETEYQLFIGSVLGGGAPKREWGGGGSNFTLKKNKGWGGGGGGGGDNY